MRQRKRVRARAERTIEGVSHRTAARVTARATAKRAAAERAGAERVTAPPAARARPIGLQTSRAGLLGRLAREPVVSRSVGLVR